MNREYGLPVPKSGFLSREEIWSSSSDRKGGAVSTMAQVAVAHRMFVTAWFFFGVAALIGVLLRMQFLYPIGGFDYGNFLHAHSHIAFLGWVYNAIFALCVRHFILPEQTRAYWRLFLVTQVSVVGILVSFPIQGYGWMSIFFSTMQMICAAIFVCKLLCGNQAGPVARIFLWVACLFMLGSGLGPVALGPIMALGLSGTVWNELSIGYYLHFQYNGWFLFFLIAVVVRVMEERRIRFHSGDAYRALGWLTVGCVLTFALSILPIRPAGFVFFVAGLGGIVQMIGAWYLFRVCRGAGAIFCRCSRLVRGLAGVALGLFFLKIVLQALASWPGLLELASNHLVIIAFMHLVFLGVVTPMLIAWSVEVGWMRLGGFGEVGVVLFGVGALVGQLALVYTALAGSLGIAGWPRFLETQLGAAMLILAGVALISLRQVLRSEGRNGGLGSEG